jgi:ATP-dependent DNA helicase RecQ
MAVAGETVDLERTLRERFGLEEFRPGQREVIENVLRGRDVLCVMPTGGGKSLCYQLPALLLKGLTLVVSPLIALMKDQVDALTEEGIRATLINSTLDPGEQRTRMADIELGKYDLVYVAPERFRSPRFLEAIGRVKPALLAVDEAHCISEWGHDFRPDYARLGWARKRLGLPPCIALTATATDLVRRDIADQLDLKDPAQFVTGFDRPNLSYRVIGASREPDKLSALAEVLDQNPGSSIVYTSARKRCEEVRQFLKVTLRRSVEIYHAGLTREERTSAQESFMSGAAEIVVATNAFGMGVDKANIRSVVHYNLPGTLEAYYQEAGRAGRDGEAAECVLLYAPGDRFLQEMFIENEYPPQDAIYEVYEYLRNLDDNPIEMTQLEIKEAARVSINESAVGACLKILEKAGAVERFRPRENMAIIRIDTEPEDGSLLSRLSPQAHVQRNVMQGLETIVGGRLGEPVYFQPDQLAFALGIERPALLRTLRQIATDLPVLYVPPFRGNAIRIPNRDLLFRDVPIDFVALAKRRNQEYEKLDRMINYARATHCRRAYILSYFGDSKAARCGRCDNCGPRSKRTAAGAARVLGPAGHEVILKALSGVARAKGRFGKTVVAQMLTGSNSEKIARFGLSRLSTFGILNPPFKQAEVVKILEALAVAGLVEDREVDRLRPIIDLTARGWDVLRGHDGNEIALALPEVVAAKIVDGKGGGGRGSRAKAKSAREDAGKPSDSSLIAFEAALGLESTPSPLPVATPRSSTDADILLGRLRSLRTAWAAQTGQPAYTVFSNETLEALVRERPRSPHALAMIRGMGPARIERYGATILQTITECSEIGALTLADELPIFAQTEIEQRPASHRPATEVDGHSAPAGATVPTEEWTCRLLDRGFSLDDAAAIRGLERSAILRHAMQMAKLGRFLPVEELISAEVARYWESWFNEHGDIPPPRDPDAPMDVWPLFVACLSQGSGR